MSTDRKKSRISRPTEISHIMQQLLTMQQNPLSDQFLRWKIWVQWREIVGSSIAKNSAPVGYDRGVLYVWVKNSAWLQQMHFIKAALQEKINKQIGRDFVRVLRFTLNKNEVPTQENESNEFKQLINKVLPQTEDEL